jgi:large subunit ribosomal protein L24
MTNVTMKIKKGDQVVVIAGKDKGKKGEVLKSMPTERRLVVKGVNVAKKHTKATQFAAGGIVEKELSIHVSNVALADPKKGTPTRVGYKVVKDGKKVRVAKASGEQLK